MALVVGFVMSGHVQRKHAEQIVYLIKKVHYGTSQLYSTHRIVYTLKRCDGSDFAVEYGLCLLSLNIFVLMKAHIAAVSSDFEFANI